MNDKFIDDLLDQAIPAVDPNARKIAINSALSEFSQGIDQTARPNDEGSETLSSTHSSPWSNIMKLIYSPIAVKAFASLAIAFVAVSVVFIIPEDQHRLDDIVASKDLSTSSPETPQASPKQNSSPANDSKTQGSKAQNDKADIGKTELEEAPLDFAKNEPTEARESTPVKSSASAPIKQSTVKPHAQTHQNSPTPNEAKQAPSADLVVDEMVYDSSELTLEEVTVAAAPMVEDTEISRILNSKPAQQPNTNAPSQTAGGVLNAAIGNAVYSDTARARVRHDGRGIGSTIADGRTGRQESRPDLNEEYAEHEENTRKLVRDEPVSTFSVDVDTASYSLVRNQLLRGYLPAVSAVRSEEMINYFNYNYALPRSRKAPFKPSVTVIDSPWNSNKKLVHIGIKGYDIPNTDMPDSNLVFLLDVSGSMSSQNKLPLVKQSINLLLETLKPTDTVSIVVYAGAAGTVLEPTKVKDKNKITEALKNLNAGGSTAGGEGIALAYQLAEQNYDENAVNRIILATDGDFNVGVQSNQDLKTLVERKRDNGVLLSVLGFGRNNYQDDMMQTLAQNGNGVAAYIDSLSEAKKVLLDEATSTLFTIAKDVKIQVEFNAATVSEYRLIGYETRHLKREDFNNDKVDAGDIGAGHTVTAIYEITPVGAQQQSVDQLRYSENSREKTSKVSDSNEYGFIKIRYKLPNETKSKLIEQAINNGPSNTTSTKASQDVQFSVAVAGFAQLLKGGKNTQDLNFDEIIRLARQNKGNDPFGYRSEFINLVGMAKIAKP